MIRCPWCGKAFDKISHYTVHAKHRHTNEFYCPVCNQTFENEHLLKQHLREYIVKWKKNVFEHCLVLYAYQNGYKRDSVTRRVCVEYIRNHR